MNGKNVLANVGLVNVRVNTFKNHGQSNEHRKLAWTLQFGNKTLVKVVVQANKSCDEVIVNLSCITYYISKNKYYPF
jgi:hypothetical protein